MPGSINWRFIKKPIPSLQACLFISLLVCITGNGQALAESAIHFIKADPPPIQVSGLQPGATTLPRKSSQTEQEVTKVVVNVPSRTLWVYSGNKIIRHFPVGLGRVGFPTPLGEFKIIRKVLDPGWENPYLSAGKMRLAPGEDNPLGTRWMGFLQNKGGEYGFHGTDNPASVGKFSSHGCIRLKVPDAEALFDLVEVGTPVHIVYQPVLVRTADHKLRVAVYPDHFRKGSPSVEAVKAAILKNYPGAVVNEPQLQAALKAPTEKYVDIGLLPLSTPNSIHPLAQQPVELPSTVKRLPNAQNKPILNSQD